MANRVKLILYQLSGGFVAGGLFEGGSLKRFDFAGGGNRSPLCRTRRSRTRSWFKCGFCLYRILSGLKVDPFQTGRRMRPYTKSPACGGPHTGLFNGFEN